MVLVEGREGFDDLLSADKLAFSVERGSFWAWGSLRFRFGG